MKKRKKKTAKKMSPALVRAHNRIKHLETEIVRLTQKCHDRSNECYLLGVQKAALESKIDALRRSFTTMREILIP